MADISKIQINGETLDIKDEVARSGGGLEVHTLVGEGDFNDEWSEGFAEIDTSYGTPIAILNGWGEDASEDIVVPAHMDDRYVWAHIRSNNNRGYDTLYINVLFKTT